MSILFLYINSERMEELGVMDIASIGQLVSMLGFPIVCCGALFWKMNEDSKKNNEKSDKFTEAINNNTLAITVLTERMGKE